MQKIFPHGMMVCGVGLIEMLGVRIQHLITCNFPYGYIEAIQQPNGSVTSPILDQWVKTRRPVLFEITKQQVEIPWLEKVQRFGLQNMAAHGQCDMRSHTISYFCFANISGELTPRHAQLLSMLVPHLHTALTRALEGDKKASHSDKIIPPKLTAREQEILQWMGSEKTNWEIAQLLNISENTVKNHVQRIMAKLDVSSRAQAVAKGLFQR